MAPEEARKEVIAMWNRRVQQEVSNENGRLEVESYVRTDRLDNKALQNTASRKNKTVVSQIAL